jgi:hypothetical protein
MSRTTRPFLLDFVSRNFSVLAPHFNLYLKEVMGDGDYATPPYDAPTTKRPKLITETSPGLIVPPRPPIDVARGGTKKKRVSNRNDQLGNGGELTSAALDDAFNKMDEKQAAAAASAAAKGTIEDLYKKFDVPRTNEGRVVKVDMLVLAKKMKLDANDKTKADDLKRRIIESVTEEASVDDPNKENENSSAMSDD